MNLNAKITVPNIGADLQKLFLNEDAKTDRASYKTKKQGNDFLIEISANDFTAFRALINSISKQLIVYEKTVEMIQNES